MARPLPQTSGTIALPGLAAPVRVVRDRAGVPHIYAESAPDLFVAQGFVQAQDRLFQMDLWRRASQGRLAEILGANFIDRDAMTRRVQYRGDVAAEWESYGPDARAIAEAFVRGVNAYVSIARARLPEEFVQARWTPSYWSAADLLNRTDAFLDSGDALDEIRRAKLPDVVADAIRLVGTPPFLVGAAPSDASTRTRAPSRAEASASGVVVGEAVASLSAPARRYLVHLVAPGWNVVGATSPWLPGVAIGHNARVAWGMTRLAVDTQDILVEPMADVTRREPELMRIKGRAQMLPFTRDVTRRGLVIASDREHERVFVLRWAGFEPGMTAGLGALALDRATNLATFRDAAARWKMPARRIVVGDADGRVATVDAAPRGARRLRRADAAPSTTGAALSATVVFPHLIHRFDVGPLPRPPDDTALRMEMTMPDWDRSRAVVAPGQSGAPASPHYADAARAWASGELRPLLYSEGAVRSAAEATLTLIPAGRR